jgi:branched-chain amino acid transport system substrate-binding protein
MDWGYNMYTCLELQAEELNAKGPYILDGQPYLFKVISDDTQFKPDLGVAAANRQILQEHVVAMVVGSDSMLSTQDICNANNIVRAVGSWTKLCPNPESPLAFQSDTTLFEMNPTFYRFLQQNYPQIKKVALTGEDTVPGRSMAELSAECAKMVGFEVTSEDLFPQGQVDFAPLITKYISQGVDFIDFGSAASGSVALLSKQAREIGYKGLIGACSGPAVEEMVAVAGEAVDGLIVKGVSWEDDDPATTAQTKDIAKRHMARWGFVKDLNFTYWDMGGILLNGYIKAGTLDPVKVMKTIKTMDYKMFDGSQILWGGHEIYGIDNQVMATRAIRVIENGKARTVFTMTPEFLLNAVQEFWGK